MIRYTFKLNARGMSTLSCFNVCFFPAYSGNIDLSLVAFGTVEIY